jgi:hypothetical protein
MGYKGLKAMLIDLFARVIFWIGDYPLKSYNIIDLSIHVPHNK